MNVESIQRQLEKLWTHVKCLGIKHQYPQTTNRKQEILNNRKWLEKLSAVEMMRDLGSGMRLGAMLSRDSYVVHLQFQRPTNIHSVKLRMESGEGMALSEFSYPLFQAYDWWSMYRNQGIQLQIGGSDQYGNIIAGMGAVSHMRKIHRMDNGAQDEEDPRVATFGLTTPLLTTASGEKFGKSAGNAVWLDDQMLSSFDLYQVPRPHLASPIQLLTIIPVLPPHPGRRRRTLPKTLHLPPPPFNQTTHLTIHPRPLKTSRAARPRQRSRRARSRRRRSKEGGNRTQRCLRTGYIHLLPALLAKRDFRCKRRSRRAPDEEKRKRLTRLQALLRRIFIFIPTHTIYSTHPLHRKHNNPPPLPPPPGFLP
jgi:hypothetical protein